jgi:uncharacterized protein
MKNDIDIVLGVEIPLRAGAFLRGTLYKPKYNATPLPVLLAATVYTADGAHQRGCFFAKNGYIFISFEMSGRGNSDGPFELWVKDGKDGFDVVEWVAQQTWSNGKVAMWGASYNGFFLWATLKELPSALTTMIPVSSVCPGVDFPAVNNIMYNYCAQWLTLIDGKTTNVSLFNDELLWGQIFYDLLGSGQSFRTLNLASRASAPLFDVLVRQPSAAVWHSLLLDRKHYEAIRIPILTIIGQYDGDHLGSLYYYKQHMQYGLREWTAHHYLIIGPWDHAGARTPGTDVGGLKVGEASCIDMNQLYLEWFNWVLQDGARPSFCQARVAYYVTGVEEWRYTNALDAIPSFQQRLYLLSPVDVFADHTIFHSGYLHPKLPVDTNQTATYRYDSRDMHAAELGGLSLQSWVIDQRYVMNIQGNGLIYHSAPFSEGVEIIGFPRFVAWLSLNVPDADFQVTLYEICQDGSSILLTQDLMRARYRNSLTEEILVAAGAIEQYEFASFRFVARKLARGSRLRVVICAPDILFWQHNYSAGGVVEDETAEVGRMVTITLYQDPDHESFLEIPVSREHATG